MATKKSIPFGTELQHYQALLSGFPEVELKGATMPYTSHQGNMFSYLSKEGILALRLPKESIEKFINAYKTGLMEAYGIIQKEYVSVPSSLLAKPTELTPWFEISLQYVKSLKSKPTKKNK